MQFSVRWASLFLDCLWVATGHWWTGLLMSYRPSLIQTMYTIIRLSVHLRYFFLCKTGWTSVSSVWPTHTHTYKNHSSSLLSVNGAPNPLRTAVCPIWSLRLLSGNNTAEIQSQALDFQSDQWTLMTSTNTIFPSILIAVPSRLITCWASSAVSTWPCPCSSGLPQSLSKWEAVTAIVIVIVFVPVLLWPAVLWWALDGIDAKTD